MRSAAAALGMLLLALTMITPVASAEPRLQPPALGKYRCLVTQIGPPDQRGVSTIQFFPSVIGSVTLKRGGRFTSKIEPHGGRWSYDRRRSRLGLRGGLLGRLRIRYLVTDGAFVFILRYKTQDHECRRASKRARAPRYARPNGRFSGTIIATNGNAASLGLGSVFAVDVRRGTADTVFEGTQPSANAAGRLVAVDKNNDIVVAERDGRVVATLAYGNSLNGPPRLEPSLSPDGQLVAHDAVYSTSGDLLGPFDHGLAVRRLDGTVQAFFPGLAEGAFAPDGTIFAVGSRSVGDSDGLEGLYAVPPPYSRGDRVGSGNEQARQPVVSPDGRRVAYVLGGALWIGAPDGSGARRFGGSGPYAHPTFAPDGSAVAALVQSRGSLSDVRILRLKGGRASTLRDRKGSFLQSAGPISWTADRNGR